MLFDLTNEYDVERFNVACKKMIGGQKFVELKEKKPLRTTNQNALLHLWLGFFAAECGYTLEEVKVDYYKRECNADIFVREKVNKFGKTIKYLRSSADLTIDEMSLSMNRFKHWASMEGGIYLPSPEDEGLIRYCRQVVENAKEYLRDGDV